MAAMNPPDVPPGAPERRTRPWGWIVACVALVLVAGGFPVWSFASPTARAGDKGPSAQAHKDAHEGKDQLPELNQQVEDVSGAVDDAGDDLAQAGDEASNNVDAALDGIKA